MIEKVRELWKVQLEEKSILSVLFYDFYDMSPWIRLAAVNDCYDKKARIFLEAVNLRSLCIIFLSRNRT